MASVIRLGLAALLFQAALAYAATNNASQPFSAPLNHSDEAQKRAQKLLEDPLRGVVVNRTITVQGHEFYRFFSITWSQLDQQGNYSVSVHERPSARWGSEIWVDYRGDRVFHMFLPPARSQTRQISQSAAHITYEEIENREVERALFPSEDLGPEEM